MLFLKKQRIINSALKFRHRDTRSVKWWLKDAGLIPAAQSVVTAIRDITEQTGPSNVKILKLNERKIVFRIKHPQDAAQSFVAKVFLLNGFSRRFKYDRYGLDEAANLIRASDRGLNTPVIYGYGHIHDILGFVKVNIVILEDLQGLSSIRMLMGEKAENECPEIFMRTIPLFIKLYRTGCKHIDVNNGNIMLCEHDLDSKVFLIDFQHVVFLDIPSDEVLMFEAGYFARSCHDRVPSETINQWLDKLLTAININGAAKVQEMRDRFNYYFDNGKYLSRKERLKIY